MSISGNYSTLQNQIADELGGRQDLLSPLSDSSLALSPIQNAIQSAISKWEREPFYFNQAIIQTPTAGPVTLSTSAGQEYYGAATTPSSYAGIATWAKIRKLWVLVSSNRYTLTERTSQYMDEISVNPDNVAQPTDWSYSAKLLRLYPIPDNTYPLGAELIVRFEPLSGDTDANVWTQDAYDLIRAESKLILAGEVLQDADLAALMVKAIYGDPAVPRMRGYLDALKAEGARRSGRGRVIPTAF